jgi:hypothetical protein
MKQKNYYNRTPWILHRFKSHVGIVLQKIQGKIVVQGVRRCKEVPVVETCDGFNSRKD